MKKLKKLIKSEEEFETFKNILIQRIINNESISNNPMLDGFVISFITYNKFVYDLFQYDFDEPQNVFDGTMQQLEQTVIWFINNEETLCKILKK